MLFRYGKHNKTYTLMTNLSVNSFMHYHSWFTK